MKNKIIIILYLAVITAFCVSCNGMVGQTRRGSLDSGERSNVGIGILMMEGTSLAVDSKQAKTLLPLWKAIKNLSGDDNVPEAEMSAVYRQIRESLTAEQLEQIQGTDWSTSDMSAVMEKYDVQVAGGADSGKTSAGNASQSQSSPGGGMPAGGGPGGDMLGGMGGDPGAMEGMSQGQNGAPVMDNGQEQSDLNVILADAVISVLAKRQEA